MQTIKRGVDFTGNVIGKCRNGHTTRYAYGPRFTAETGQREACGTPGCDRVLNLDRCQPIYGRFVAEKICDGRCMGATGKTCECQCGGMNHGGNHEVAAMIADRRLDQALYRFGMARATPTPAFLDFQCLACGHTETPVDDADHLDACDSCGTITPSDLRVTASPLVRCNDCDCEAIDAGPGMVSLCNGCQLDAAMGVR